MRKCLRCETEMVENLTLTATNGSYELDVKEKGMFKSVIDRVKCAVCPKCGYVETYINNTEKLQKLIDKEK